MMDSVRISMCWSLWLFQIWLHQISMAGQQDALETETRRGGAQTDNYAWLVVTLDLLSNILLDENGFRANGNHLCNLCNFTDTLYMSVRMYYIKLLPQVFKTDKGIQIFFYQCWISLPLILLHALLYMSFLDMLGSLALWSSVCCSTTLVQNEIQYFLKLYFIYYLFNSTAADTRPLLETGLGTLTHIHLQWLK